MPSRRLLVWDVGDISDPARRELLRRACAGSLPLQAAGFATGWTMLGLLTDLPLVHRLILAVYETLAVSFLTNQLLHLRRLLVANAADRQVAAADRVVLLAVYLASAPWAALPWMGASGSFQTSIVCITVTLASGALTAMATVAEPRWCLAVSGVGGVSMVIAVGSGLTALSPLMAPLSAMFVLVLLASNRQIYQVTIEAVVGRLEQERLGRELEARNEELRYRAMHDALTGLANRSLFEEALTSAIARSRRSGHMLAVIYVDLDRFKVINDSLGHAVGDDLLVAVADRLRQRVRDHDLVARLGGDEFVVLMPEVASADDAVAVARRVESAFLAPYEMAGRSMVVTGSIGVACGTGEDLGEDLLRFADDALYSAKRAGRARVTLFDRASSAALTERIDHEVRVRAAIEQREIEPWYQPVVDPCTGRVVALEALARWRHPTKGVLSPAHFLPTVTEAGMTGLLGQSILNQALAFRHRLLDAVPDDLRVYVNVIADRSTLADVVGRFAQFAAAAQVPPSAMGMELTEQAVIDDVATARAALEHFRSLGFAVALDDFGTGYSPLALVRDLPLDVVKLDRSFVLGMLDNGADEAVVVSVIELARRLGAKVTAEGVETVEQRDRLRALGAHGLQGYLYAPALPGAEIEARLRCSTLWELTDAPLPSVA